MTAPNAYTVIQTILLKFYAQVQRTGLLSTPLFRKLFLFAYDAYKRVLEAGDIDGLQMFVRPNEVIVDVGANVGFFTKRFATWVQDEGYVIAIEPETKNYAQLTRTVTQFPSDTVQTIQAAVSDHSGTVNLAINPIHPGDHRVAEEGVAVRAIMLDELEISLPVCLLKIDVQGAEHRVLNGAQQVITRDHPAIYMELDDEALHQMDSNTAQVLALLESWGYHPHQFQKDRNLQRLTAKEALSLSQNGNYADLLFLTHQPKIGNQS
jgi:FkbM family methyltransferase